MSASARLAKAGAEVHVTGRNSARGAAAEAMSFHSGGSITYHQCDLSSATAATDFMHKFGASLKGRKVDLVVQNLATMQDSFATNEQGDELTIGTNLKAFHTIGQSFLRPGSELMAPGARMINVVS